jgi:hypothetical protein
MSNFIDHWLNSIPIEEATRAKKLKRKGGISPEDYAQAEQTLEQKLSRYVTDNPNKMYYITFISDMGRLKDSPDDGESQKRSPPQSKVGINPQSRYDTPNGIYTYPLTPELFRTLVDGRIGGHGFAQNAPFIGLLKPKDYSKILQVQKSEGGEYADSETVNDILNQSDGGRLKMYVHKLFSKDSPIRKKIRDTQIEDYSIGKRLVWELEKEIILDSAKNVGYSRTGVNSDLELKKFKDFVLELNEDGELHPQTSNILSQMVKKLGNEKQLPAAPTSSSPIPNMTTAMHGVVLKVIESSSKAMNSIEPKSYNYRPEEISELLAFIKNTKKKLNTEKMKFVTVNPSNNAVEETYFSPNSPYVRLAFHITSCMMLGYLDTLNTDLLRPFDLATSTFDIIKSNNIQELQKEFLNTIVLVTDAMDEMRDHFEYEVKTDKGKSVAEIKKMQALMWRVLSKLLAKLRNLPEPIKNVKEIQKIEMFIKFGRFLFHPSRFNNSVTRETRAMTEKENPLSYPFEVFKDSDILNNLDLSSYIDEEFDRPVNRMGALVDFHYFMRGNYDILIDMVKKSTKMPESDEEISAEERDALDKLQKRGSTNARIDRDVYDGLVERFYNPSIDQLMNSRQITSLMDQSRRYSAYGFLWNITRNLAGERSQRRSPTSGVDFKKVPALWNTIWRYLGIEGVADLQDSGTIHPAETTQAVFFNSAFIDVVDIFDNTLKHGRKRGFTGAKLKSLIMKKNIAYNTNHDFNQPTYSNLALPSELSVKTVLDSKYESVFNSFISQKNVDDEEISTVIKKFIKNKLLTNLIIFGVMYEGAFWQGFKFMMLEAYKALISKFKSSEMRSRENVINIFKLYLKDDYESFSLLGAGGRAMSEEENDTLRYFLVPAVIIKYLTNVPYTDEEINAGKIKIDSLRDLDYKKLITPFKVAHGGNLQSIAITAVNEVTNKLYQTRKAGVSDMIVSGIQEKLKDAAFVEALTNYAQADFLVTKTLKQGTGATLEQSDNLRRLRLNYETILTDFAQQLIEDASDTLINKRSGSIQRTLSRRQTRLFPSFQAIYDVYNPNKKDDPFPESMSQEDLKVFAKISLQELANSISETFGVGPKKIDFKIPSSSPVNEMLNLKQIDSLIIEMENFLNE